MHENLLSLIEKSEVFDPHSSRTFQTKIRVKSMDDYRFFLCNCFFHNADNPVGPFVRSMKMFLKQYMKTWASNVSLKSKDFDWEKYSHDIFDFFEGFKWNDIYHGIESGDHESVIRIKANHSALHIRRFGNILAFDVRPTTRQGEHEGALLAIKSLCRSEVPGNNQCIYDLVDKVELLLTLPMEKAKENIFNFDLIFQNIKTALPWVEWDFDHEKLIENYKNGQDSYHGLKVGKYFGFDIFARLIHEGEKVVNHHTDNKIWYKGNVEYKGEQRYEFTSVHDIFLEISIKSSLPTGYNNIDIQHDVHTEQFEFAKAATIFITSLSNMQLHKNIESRRELNP